MASILQHRKGTRAGNDLLTGALAELSVDVDSKALRVHDGAKAGGYELGMAQANGMADLRTHTPAIGARRYLTHHTTDGDGGHGVFRAVIGGYLAAQDNNGTVIVVGMNAWMREFSSNVNAKWFGAVADGAADDTAAIQAAVNVMFATGKALFFSRGTYLISSTITMGNTLATTDSPIYFKGEGRSSIIKCTTAINPFLIQGINPDIDGAGNRFTGRTILEKMSFQGAGSFGFANAGTGIKWYGAQGITLRDVYISGWDTGLMLQNVDLISVYASWITNNNKAVDSEATGYALNSSLNSLNFYGGFITNNLLHGIRLLGGMAPCFFGTNFVANGTSLIFSPDHPTGAMVTSAPNILGCYFEADTGTTIVFGGGNGIVRGGVIRGSNFLAGSAFPIITIANYSNSSGRGLISNNGYDISHAGSSVITQSTSAEKIDVTIAGDLSSESLNNTRIGEITPTSGRFTYISTPELVFPSVQAPSSNPNALDDYEEGLWTPVLAVGGLPTGITYLIQLGRYTKIGRTVEFSATVYLSSKGVLTGALSMTLPFVSVNTGGWPDKVSQGISVHERTVSSVDADRWYITNNSNVISMGTLVAPMLDTNIQSNSILRVSGTYEV